MNDRTPLWVEYVRAALPKTLTSWLGPDPNSLAVFLPQITNHQRNNPNMDYSVGGPLWLEWQRLQTHSEWDRWSDIYSEGSCRQPLIRFKVYYDWLLENGFELEASEVAHTVAGKVDWMPFPPFTPSVSKYPNPEPVEGAA